MYAILEAVDDSNVCDGENHDGKDVLDEHGDDRVGHAVERVLGSFRAHLLNAEPARETQMTQGVEGQHGTGKQEGNQPNTR